MRRVRESAARPASARGRAGWSAAPRARARAPAPAAVRYPRGMLIAADQSELALDQLVPGVELARTESPARTETIFRQEVTAAESVILLAVARNDHAPADLVGAKPVEPGPGLGDVGVFAVVDEALRCHFPGKAACLDRLMNPAGHAQRAAAQIDNARWECVVQTRIGDGTYHIGNGSSQRRMEKVAPPAGIQQQHRQAGLCQLLSGNPPAAPAPTTMASNPRGSCIRSLVAAAMAAASSGFFGTKLMCACGFTQDYRSGAPVAVTCAREPPARRGSNMSSRRILLQSREPGL